MMVDYSYHYRGEPDAPIYSTTLIPLASSFTRVVHGKRGAYVEFDDSQIFKGPLYVPEKAKWRGHSKIAYYEEFRNSGCPEIKIYLQRKPVEYADYRVGFWYINVNSLRDFILGRDIHG